METDSRKIRQVCREVIRDLDPDKLAYAIQLPDMVTGMKKTFVRYGIEYTKDVHNDFVFFVNGHLSGNPDIEYEWNERQYDNFVKFSPIPQD